VRILANILPIGFYAILLAMFVYRGIDYNSYIAIWKLVELYTTYVAIAIVIQSLFFYKHYTLLAWGCIVFMLLCFAFDLYYYHLGNTDLLDLLYELNILTPFLYICLIKIKS
jgi:hypothetical protein